MGILLLATITADSDPQNLLCSQSYFSSSEKCHATQYKDIGTIFHKLHSGYFIFYNRKKNLLKTQISKIIRKQQQQ